MGVGLGHRFVNFGKVVFVCLLWIEMSSREKCFCVWNEERDDLKLRNRREKLKQQPPVGLHVTSRVFQVLVTSVERGWRLDSCPFPHSQPSQEPRIILTPHK